MYFCCVDETLHVTRMPAKEYHVLILMDWHSLQHKNIDVLKLQMKTELWCYATVHIPRMKQPHLTSRLRCHLHQLWERGPVTVSDVDGYVSIIKLLHYTFNKHRHSYNEENIHFYSGYFFRKVAYTGYNVRWLVERMMDFSNYLELGNGCRTTQRGWSLNCRSPRVSV
jgi:hypothetical protein